MRHHFTTAQRRRIWHADSIPLTGERWAVCRCCGKPIRKGQAWDVSHEIPFAHWPRWLAWLGRDADWQVAVCHPHCNRSMGAVRMKGFQLLSFRTKLWITLAFLFLFAVILFFFFIHQ
jgi:hypothetical protein